ncbi:MAG: HlyD family efflux transporter periplasmic adaptor subunit [Deltaproteobacteria bacterium]|nr:HlyD family efflux transporter periplasmic adaptor subunit [Deltaproteobacteria bacterium]
MEQESIIYKNILANMSDGVMTIDLKGQIITFNPAAANILDLKEEDVLGKKFAQVFFEYEGNDDFNQAILDAIYESNVGHRAMVDFDTGEKKVSLSLSTSFLQDRRGGDLEKVAIIAVFSDVTEVKQLRDAEIRLTEDLKAKHEELRDAYLKIEESNENLNAALKRVQVVRIVATIFIIAIFLGTGLFMWNKKPAAKARTMSRSLESAQDVTQLNTFVVQPRSVSSTISLPGILEPLKVVNVVSPLTGKVKERLFNYGDHVEKGQVLVKMDTSEVEVRYREAKAGFMKSLQQLRELKNWENGSEVRRSRRSLTMAKRSVESQQRRLDDTERLYAKGIVPASEYESAKEQLHNLKLDYKAAREELNSVLERGSAENIEIARLETENARVKVRYLKAQMKTATILAPVSGIVILPDVAKDKRDSKTIEKGISFDQGQVMVLIGDLEGLSVKTRVDEVEISKIKKGQKVIVSGDAFSDISLDGEISHISSQATKEGDIPSFEITVKVKHLSPEHRRWARLGMSANLEVVIYGKSDALMVPIDCVRSIGSDRFVGIRDKETLKIKEVKVETGITTLDSVEILKGLKPGDEVVN